MADAWPARQGCLKLFRDSIASGLSFRSAQENTPCPFRAAGGLECFSFGGGQSDHQRLASALVFGDWRSAGSWCHNQTIAQYKNFGNLLDAKDFAAVH
jgi:hypothetical protein